MSVPQLRFKDESEKDFPAWEVRELGNVFRVTRGNVLSMTLVSGIPSVENCYPVYSSQTKNNGLSGYYSQYLYENSITWTTDGANAGDVNFRKGRFYCTNVCGVLINTDGYANTCVAEMINAVAKRHVSYVGNPKLMNNIMAKIKIAFPSVAEQAKIASFLTAVDEKITQLTQKCELLTHYKKGVMQQIFSQELRFKNEDGRDYPEWEATTLGAMGKFTSGTGFPEIEQGGNSGIPFYKVSDMNLAGNEFEMIVANNYVDDEQVKKLKFKVIAAEAIIFAKVGAAIFLERKRKAKNFLIDNNMMAFIPTCDITFAKHYFDTVSLSKFAQVGALPSYNASDLSIINIALFLTGELYQRKCGAQYTLLKP